MYGSKEFARVARGCEVELYIYGPGPDPFKLMQYFLISNFGLLIKIYHKHHHNSHITNS